MSAERDALAALVAAWDSEAYNREWGQRMTAAIAAARAALAAPAQGEPQERMGTHWDGCSTEGGPRHYDCAVAAIAALRAENERQAREIARLTKARDEWIGRAQGSRNNTETMIERAERAEYERDDWKRKYGDANEWGLRNTAAWKDRAERAEAERDALRECVRAADAMRGSYLSRYMDEYDAARAKVQP